jgi:hypothetical protein
MSLVILKRKPEFKFLYFLKTDIFTAHSSIDLKKKRSVTFTFEGDN